MQNGSTGSVIKSEIMGDLKWAKASYNSVNGKIISYRNYESDRLSMEITVPVNTSATIYIPFHGIRFTVIS